jgi:hypothetical protein
MPTAVEISESLRAHIGDDGANTLTRRFFIADLVSGSGVNRFLSAWNYLGMTLPPVEAGGPTVTLPRANDRIIFAKREVFAKDMDLEPWADSDAILTVNYREDNTDLGGFDGVELESGTTYEQDITDFTGDERDKPFNQRKPMYFLHDPTRTNGRPSDLPEYRKMVRAPVLVGKSFRRFTKTLGSDPAPLGETYACMTNSTTWKGYPPETALVLSIVGRNAGRVWRTTMDVAIDKIGKFRYTARVTDPQTGEPAPLTPEMIANANGIDEFIVQGRRNLNPLPF